jgi:hypothetical protein
VLLKIFCLLPCRTRGMAVRCACHRIVRRLGRLARSPRDCSCCRHRRDSHDREHSRHADEAVGDRNSSRNVVTSGSLPRPVSSNSVMVSAVIARLRSKSRGQPVTSYRLPDCLWTTATVAPSICRVMKSSSMWIANLPHLPVGEAGKAVTNQVTTRSDPVVYGHTQPDSCPARSRG